MLARLAGVAMHLVLLGTTTRAGAQLPDDSRAATSVARAPDTLRIVHVTTRGAEDPGTLGVRLGAEEAERTARLFGRTVSVGIIATADTASLLASVRSALARRAVAIVTPCDAPLCLRVFAEAARRNAIVVNIAAESDTLRSLSCMFEIFHVAPSAGMRRDAERLGGRAGAVAWLPSLERYGAEQLNARYRAASGGREMDERAWSGWMAVKVLTEAWLRSGAARRDSLSKFLQRDGVRFDGHKGVPLSFRSWDRQLRQPLYLPAAGGADGPDGGATTVPPAGGPGSPAERLDQLDAAANARKCLIEHSGP